MSNTPEDISRAIAGAASDKKAEDIVILRMAELTTAADYFIVCSANTTTQVRAIADNIEDELEKLGKSYLHKEGYREGEWVLLDYGDCVAHVFMTESRAFYALERLWSDAPLTHYED